MCGLMGLLHSSIWLQTHEYLYGQQKLDLVGFLRSKNSRVRVDLGEIRGKS